MQSSEVKELHYLVPSNPTPYPAHFSLTHNNTPTFHFSRFSKSNPLYHLQITPQVQEFNSQSTCFSSNSTSDEADEQQLSLIHERKQRRMISNRESARRSRMRKQKQLDELWSQVVWLRNENHHLIDKLNHVSECRDKVLQDNAQLKEEASELRQMLTDMQLNSPYPTLRDLDDVP
uniref:Putative basic leucine zipper 43 n=1 Tax=Davidia involucrata TaxID=16924 RepID=A0A5B7AZY1_DAVIN